MPKDKARIPRIIVAKDEVLPFVQKFYWDKGYMPSNQEIGDAFKKTKQWAHGMLKVLEKDGYISIGRNKNRSIKIK